MDDITRCLGIDQKTYNFKLRSFRNFYRLIVLLSCKFDRSSRSVTVQIECIQHISSRIEFDITHTTFSELQCTCNAENWCHVR